MPRFYLHLRIGEDLERDPEGFEAPDLDAARAEALRVMRELRDDWAEQAMDMTRMAIEIEDEHGATVMTIPFRGGPDGP